MTAPDDLPYSITGRETVAEADGMRVQIMTLGAGEVIPWHYHTTITDVFVGLEGQHSLPAGDPPAHAGGRVVIDTRAPRACHELEPGNHCVVPPLTAHQVSSKDSRGCRFTLVQGVGEHDFIPVGKAAAQD